MCAVIVTASVSEVVSRGFMSNTKYKNIGIQAPVYSNPLCVCVCV